MILNLKKRIKNMLQLRQVSKLAFGIAALLVTSCAYSNNQVRVFECRATAPFALEIEISKSRSGLVVSQAMFHGNQFDSVFIGKEYTNDHYHRAFVDEKSVMFNIDEYKVTLSDYSSEEFGLVPFEQL